MDLPFSKAFLRKDYLSRAKTASAVVALTLAILTLYVCLRACTT